MSRPLFMDFHSHVDSSQREYNSADWLLSNQSHCSSSNPLSNGDSSSETHQCSYTQLLCNDSSSWNNSIPWTRLPMEQATFVSAANRTLISAVDMAANAPLTPKLHSQVGNQGYNSGNFLLTNQNCNNGSYPSSKVINRPLNTAFHSQVENSQRDCNSGIWLPSNQFHYSSSNPLSNGNSSSQMYQYGFPIPLDSSYDLNLSPRTEADAASCVDNQLQFTTNQAKNLEHNGLSAILKCLTDESPSKEKDEQVKLVMSLGEEAIQKYGDELLHNIVESSSAGLSTPYKEKQDLDRESDRGIDLNKTPEQKTPKRRKHRPKVIIEGKPKRTPKPATTKNSESKETQPGKRKYVRKNKQEESASQPANVPRETTDPTVGKGEKSCRRALNFGLGETINENKGKTVGQQEEMQQGNKRTFDLTLDSQVTDMGIGTNHMSKTKSSERIGLHNDLMVEIQIPGTMSNPTPSMNHMPNNYTFLPERRESTAPIATKKYVQMGNLHVTGRQVDNGNSDLCQRRCSYSCSPMHKKQKFENGGYYMSIYGMPSKVTPVEECPGNAERKGANDVNTNGFASNLNHTLLSSYIESIAEGQNNGINESTKDRYIHPMAFGHNSLKQQLSSKLHSGQEFTQSRCFSTHSTIETCNQLASSLPRKSFQPENRQVFQTCDHISAKKQTVGPTVSKSVSSGTNKSLQEQDTLYDYQQFSAKKKGLPKRTVYPIRIDDIIYQFNCLNLNGSCSTLQKKEQNALVPYKGDGAVVPYEGFEFFKKRKPRPKVELDPETNRIWNLLMGKEGSGGIEGTDNEKEKYWEEERKVFQGRVESFIARMHLVQGDRRFSQWKGSVVDSVIGVFLTQNVSDHLSSSAFMSLAARFPLKSMSDCQTQDKVGTNILVNEPEVCMTSPVDATKWHEKLSSQQISMTLHESAEHQRESETSGTESKLVKAHSQGMEEEFVSFQDSFDLSVTQGTVGITSHSVSGSEVEDPTTGCNPNKIHSFSTYQEMEGTTMFRDFYHQVNGNPVLNDGSKHGHIEYGKLKTRSERTDHLNLKNLTVQLPVDPSSNNQFESFSEESISSSSNMEKDENCKSLRNKELSGSVVNSSVQQNILWKSRETPPKDPYLSFRPDQQTNYQPRPSNGYNQPSCNSQHEGNQTFQLDTTSVTEPIKDTEPLLGKQNGSMQHVLNVNELKKNSFNVVNSISIVNEQFDSENPLVDSNSEKRLYSFGQSQNERVTNISKGKKGKGESEKKNPVDWDILRKQVQANGGKKDRNKGTMDSLDYEALIHANVKEISDAIKERGMNNMLAERIQEFLNRLVREHGSTDLEWLRDIPPDKAKDYLLSIRGLGLKSVECVRLLTLHHLAFPVDTNVGRIAVRLGWVPLQPLPESLQLHLLELYPMLESIQKYLWPRLCKLDQLTLYELHYQMITFGKVFCTKSKPNCNACPMRGECRHFASAFASARLALPGPEEKSIVSSTVPIAVEKIPTIAVNPMSLPPPENNSLQKAGAEINWCEPIIEEPATPEQEFTELSQVDIEDLFYEDPDEIPTIKLNMEEFTVTLQNYMQEKMELQEGDMSKALVALNPEAASIPTNKLKNVSRLRTEHQVYELPDSHPLLEGMDRREPDDPSPYLLAIWTPGETANSVQPPESRCGSEDQNKLCTEKTCFSCNSIREANLQTVRGTILIPCRTAMRGRFPLNGTYFQVNEMFADNDSSVSPIDVPRGWIWNLPRRTVYFGTSVSTIFKGLSTEGIQYCFWRGYVCVRGFDRKTRAPRPLMARLHFPASKLIKTKNEKTR